MLTVALHNPGLDNASRIEVQPEGSLKDTMAAGARSAETPQMRRIVERAVRQNPPPTLRSLALQLGYQDRKVVTRYFAGLCAELLARRRALAKRQIAQSATRAAILHSTRTRSVNGRGVPQAGFEASNGQSKVPGRIQAHCVALPAAAPDDGWTPATVIRTADSSI